MKAPILIIGPNGFLASHLIQALAAANEVIVGLGKSKVDLAALKVYDDLDALKKAVPDVSVIYLLGSFIPYGSFHLANRELTATNIKLPTDLSLLYPEARIVFSSSVSVYGTPLSLPVDLKSNFNNPDRYGMSKIAGEAIVGNHDSYFILRFSSIIGKGMKPVTMIPKMINQAADGKIVVYGDGSRLQNYIDVRDAVKMCMRAADLNVNGCALGVGVQSVSNLEVAETIVQRTGAMLEFTGEDRSPSFVYDAEDSFRMLNFRPEFSIKQTLDWMIG